MHLDPIEDHFQDPKTIQEPLKSRVPLEPVFEHVFVGFRNLILGPKNLTFFVICGVIFWTTFWSLFGPLLESFWTQFGNMSAQEGGKMSPRGSSRASKSQKVASSKTLKNIWFFKVFGVQRSPKEPQEVQEGSQEAPKELQHLKRMGSSSWPEPDFIDSLSKPY